MSGFQFYNNRSGVPSRMITYGKRGILGINNNPVLNYLKVNNLTSDNMVITGKEGIKKEGKIIYNEKSINYYDGNEWIMLRNFNYKNIVQNPLLKNMSFDGPVVHVSTNGNNSNNGKNLKNAYLTIQHAIDTISKTGGIILVHPGVYSLSTSILINELENITLLGVEGAKNTIITRPDYTLDDEYRLLTVIESPSTYVNGFTFENGHSLSSGGEKLAGNGGGILLVAGDDPPGDTGATVEDCIIRNCFATQYGGGIHIDDKKGLISRCIVDNCNVTASGLNGGGGISLRYEGYAFNCLVSRCNGAFGSLLCNLGICRVYNCTVAGNGPNSSGIVLSGSTVSGHRIYNCISFENAPNDIVVASGLSDITNTINSNNLGTNASTADPLFQDSDSGDYRIDSTSPAINYGISLSLERDLMQNRIVNNDIGCYQYTPKSIDIFQSNY
jgi:hypothetical protein